MSLAGSSTGGDPVHCSDIVKEGFLLKQSKHIKRWRRRHFVLTTESLSSFRKPGDDQNPTESIQLKDCLAVRSADDELGRQNSFRVDMPRRAFYLVADTTAEMEAWMGHIARLLPSVIEGLSAMSATPSTSDSGKGKGSAPSGYGSGEGAGKGSGKAQALGAVQQAFGAAEKGYEKAWEAMTSTEEFKSEWGEVLNKMSPMEQKLLSIRTLLPVARVKVQSEPESNSKKRAGILQGYRGKAAGKGIPWKESMEHLSSRGMDVWEKEREACTDAALVYPAYWDIGGKGTLHSYDAGNCCWTAAFDLPVGAYELVHAHHFPDVPAQECFFKLHRALDDATLDALEGGPANVAVDVGCGAGTSSFSLRETLNSRGFESCQLSALDLSTYFIAVAQYRLTAGDKKGTAGSLDFRHGNALDTKRADGEVDIFMASAITHEMPKASSEALIAEAARVLRPGGVFGYFDLNPVQLLRDNPVSNIVDRVAISNEPFLDDFLEFDLQAALKNNGLELVEIRSTNKEKWPNWEDCPCRILIAKKPSASSR